MTIEKKSYFLINFPHFLVTVNCINCYSCGSSTYECKDKNDVKKVRCGQQFSSCANMVKFFKSKSI